MNYTNSPYKDIPVELLEKYNMCGTIPILSWWLDGTGDLEQKTWDDEYLNIWIANFTIHNINNNIQGWEPYPGTAKLLLQSFLQYNINNKNIAVIGSIHPWIEAILLNLNNNITTVEYNPPIVITNKKLTSISYINFENTIEKYDVIVSFSSIEHSGLGRYGDPLDPDGDIKTMKCIYEKLMNNGLLIIGIPVGHDALVWNVHRVYGKIRLPLLFQNFKELKWIGFDKNLLLNAKLESNGIQPVIVLQK